jgi:hypothetical protein
MKQFTEEQAIAFAKSEVWKDWTDEEIVRLQLFQNRICVDFNRFHRALNAVLKRPVFHHELISKNYNNVVEEYLGTKEPPTMEEIINLIPEDKRLMLNFE